MAIRSGTARFLVAALCLAALGGFAPARAEGEGCRALSAGYNGLSREETCYALDVPESTDMLRLSSDPSSYYSDSDPVLGLSSSVDPSQPGLCGFGGYRMCTIPGPEAARMYVHIRAYPRRGSSLGVVVEFVEAVPVTGGTVDSFWRYGDARMYRFDGLDNAAIISLASGNDYDLSVRRGSPPNRAESDCVSARHDGRGVPFGQLHPGADACLIGAGVGPVYAFVTLWRTTSLSINIGCVSPLSLCVGDACNLTGGQFDGLPCGHPGQFAILGAGA